MKSKKPTKLTKKDKAWKQKIEQRTQKENVVLDHPQGKERFDQIIRRAKATKEPSN